MTLVHATALHWKYSGQKWTIPNEGRTGFIETLDKTQVLSVIGELIEHAEIALETKNTSDSVHQLWERGPMDSGGYFTIKSSTSDLFLTRDKRPLSNSRCNPCLGSKYIEIRSFK